VRVHVCMHISPCVYVCVRARTAVHPHACLYACASVLECLSDSCVYVRVY